MKSYKRQGRVRAEAEATYFSSFEVAVLIPLCPHGAFARRARPKSALSLTRGASPDGVLGSETSRFDDLALSFGGESLNMVNINPDVHRVPFLNSHPLGVGGLTRHLLRLRLSRMRFCHN